MQQMLKVKLQLGKLVSSDAITLVLPHTYVPILLQC